MARIPIASLVTAGSPRLEGEDAEHVRVLADAGGALPPIVVHLPSRRVIDGMHRLRAAILRGEEEIDARFFHGTEADVFLLSVAANIQHGLPLSQRDRMAAAERIFVTHPEWSDRMVAIVVGMSNKKVGRLRRQVAGDIPQPAVRIGRDGRVRPVDGSAGRERAAKLIARDPDASLRRIAREAGISPATAADVRDRVRRGEDPVLPRHGARAKAAESEAVTGKPAELGDPVPMAPSITVIAELVTGFERLRRDPSLRFTEAGRALLRMFEACLAVVRHEETIKKGLPPHCLSSMAELSHAYASVLKSFAAELQQLETTHSSENCESVG
ncbi:Chromosome segregation protein Spo0J, contains ParB-like nuclease domain [Actinomadura madurae]|uniref:Chromosome segregation protein Spo0J, contains ParB-like nuclease domain n=1 Tax=Actinomadura madurae TaxID=1993 RepID=A0A1I5P6H2_9ACTN|nr:Chromosome segregation protein Spo0J, contains ParB-like nuclease domain [Actinomadura madurae]SPT63815.1 ParB-like nuclease domain [Actinomadura madurae]